MISSHGQSELQLGASDAPNQGTDHSRQSQTFNRSPKAERAESEYSSGNAHCPSQPGRECVRAPGHVVPRQAHQTPAVPSPQSPLPNASPLYSSIRLSLSTIASLSPAQHMPIPSLPDPARYFSADPALSLSLPIPCLQKPEHKCAAAVRPPELQNELRTVEHLHPRTVDTTPKFLPSHSPAAKHFSELRWLLNFPSVSA